MVTAETLRDSELFQGLSTDALRQIHGLGVQLAVRAGASVFRIGDQAANILVIGSGKVELTFPIQILGEVREIVVETLETRRALGWSALAPPYRFTMSARAAADTEFLAFARSDLHTFFDGDPKAGLIVMNNVAQLIGHRLNESQALWARELQRSISQRYR